MRCKVSDSKLSIHEIDHGRARSRISAFQHFVKLKVRSKREDKFLNREDRPAQCPPGKADLVTRAQKGEESAFEALFVQHKQRVYSLCLRMTGNTADAEELTQEAFLQVFRKIQTFRGESAFSTWLHRLSVNTVLMRLRKKKVNEMPLEDSARGEEFDEPQKEFGVCDLVLAGAIDRTNLNRAIAQLPSGYRRAFVLHDVHGYEHNEIATLLGCSIGNSKSQLHKARVRLRKLLQETGREFRQPKIVHANVV
jgi:RNA polymerase sigma-70 factor, ECF subfamily